MMTKRQKHPLEDLLPDYLNDRVSAADRQAIEQAAETDPDFNALIRFERRIQSTIQAEASQAATSSYRQPSFRDFSAQLEQPPRWRLNLTTAVASFAMLTIATVAGYGVLTSKPAIDEYQTLTDPGAAGSQQVLRIVASESLTPDAIEALAQLWGVEVERHYPSVNAWEFVADDETDDLAELASRLKGDQRLRSVQLIEGQR